MGDRHPALREFKTSSTHYGRGVSCHAGVPHNPPGKPAGNSQRVSAYYRTNGVLQHRAEHGCRETKGAGGLTEPIPACGTMRKSTMSRQLPVAGASVVGAGISDMSGGLSRSRRRGTPAPSELSLQSESCERTLASSGRLSQDSARSSVGCHSRVGTTWNFEQIPEFERTSRDYGKTPARLPPQRPAGKCESGFIDNDTLIQALTRW